MSEYIRKRKIDTNKCPNIYSSPIYSNIRIFEYIRHTLIGTGEALSGTGFINYKTFSGPKHLDAAVVMV